MLHHTDNRNVEIIFSVGSRKKKLHMEATVVYRLCWELGMCLPVEWASRDENMRADELLTFEDSNDYIC